MAKAQIVQKELSPELQKQRDKDSQKVRGIFRFYELPGALLEFVYRAYAGDKVEKYSLKDGEVYTLPVGVARHLNKNGWYPVHGNTVDETGKPIVTISKKVYRFGFQSLEFTDIDELDRHKQIVTVSPV